MNRALVAVAIFGGVILALMLAARALVFRPFDMPSSSMQPNLEQGDYFLVTEAPVAGIPRRGDIIVFRLPSDGHTNFIKRLIGMPGDRVQLKAGQLYINGKPVAEKPLGVAQGDLPSGVQAVKLEQETNPDGRSYEIQVSLGEEVAGDTGVYVVPQHCYFTLGDNRDNALDSRFDPGVAPDDPKLGGCGWNSALDDQVGDQSGVGFVPEANVVGKAQLVLFSLSDRPGRFFKALH